MCLFRLGSCPQFPRETAAPRFAILGLSVTAPNAEARQSHCQHIELPLPINIQHAGRTAFAPLCCSFVTRISTHCVILLIRYRSRPVLPQKSVGSRRRKLIDYYRGKSLNSISANGFRIYRRFRCRNATTADDAKRDVPADDDSGTSYDRPRRVKPGPPASMPRAVCRIGSDRAKRFKHCSSTDV